MSRIEREQKAKILKALAFYIHKKEPAVQALTQCFEAEGRGGKHRQWKPAQAVLETDGFVPALLTGELIGQEAAQILSVVEAAGDHRLLSAAINALVEYHENADD